MTPEQNFWSWFQRNDDELFDFEKNQDTTFKNLTTQLHEIEPHLAFEFGPKKDGKREFTISADGIREAFSAVERLYAAAPSLPRWKFLKFRQRRQPSDISYEGVSVKAQSVRVAAKFDGQRANIVVFIPGYTKEPRNSYPGIAFLLLDQALGEYDVETRVGEIKVEASPLALEHTISLEELPKVVDRMFVH